MGSLETYIGKRIELSQGAVEIVRREIRGQRVWLVGRDHVTGEEVLVSLRALLRNVARGNARLTSVGSTGRVQP